MTWGKVDDKLHMAQKWRGASKGARALWTTALSWCNDQLTDGRVPAHMLGSLDGTPREAADLVRVRFWHAPGHDCDRCPAIADGWVFHDWTEYQPSREQVVAERHAAAERQRRARERAAERRAAEADASRRDSRVTSPVSHGPPDPTRPDP